MSFFQYIPTSTFHFVVVFKLILAIRDENKNINVTVIAKSISVIIFHNYYALHDANNLCLRLSGYQNKSEKSCIGLNSHT